MKDLFDTICELGSMSLAVIAVYIGIPAAVLYALVEFLSWKP